MEATVDQLFAIIGIKEVSLTLANARINAQAAEIAELKEQLKPPAVDPAPL